MMASLYAGVSGLRNHQIRMNVIGNNVANVNTIGYKGGRVTFREALVQDYKGAGRPTDLSGGTNPVQMGLGMQVSTIDNLFQQGGLETTGQVTDMAIQGSGFFVLADNSGVFYSRAGAFNFDANANLVDPSSGLFVQGRMANGDGTIPVSNPIGQITVPFGQQDPARATTEVVFGNNLDSMATDSIASLLSAGTTGIDAVIGSAVNGAGGVHTLDISGAQATNSIFTGANLADDGAGAPGIVLSNSMTLSSLGVTDTSGFQLSRDNGSMV
ncbi:MAG: flagellar hook-basal body complex protein, partial [Planctomycetes bacterium]|nr:flagellar hook-basal body complex protein [Planctomycetota bacterium]